ncbi:SDR family NAD(P)-dependent oxidoreductase [Chitinophaga defluvii]|uniref:3-oxoacyl-ACP reductase family protein n=1 Tax=Chitinophaga defluvii TaxID=3163343 RepID=A0ABV2T403_9BACT
MKRLENKVALVTGGSRGMGAAIAKRLAAEGATVVITYHRSPEKAQAVITAIEKSGQKGLAIAADSADPAAVMAAVNTTVGNYGRIDILVNNAGIYIGKPVSEYTLADYNSTMDVNVKAVFFASTTAAAHMPRGGRIISIGSNMAERAGGTQTVLYTMSKTALTGLTKGLAHDLGPKGITINLVQPGHTDTDMNPADGVIADMVRDTIPTGGYGTVEDIASLVAYLASEESRYINGASLTIDGGVNA